MSGIQTPFQLHLQSRNARFAGACVEHFGDPHGELAALRAGPTLHPLTQDGLLHISGPDAQSFLQSQLSNDVRELGPARAQLTTWCTSQGRMLATCIAWCEDDGYFLQLPLELVSKVRTRLQRYVLRARATLADASASRALLGLAGKGALEAVAAVFDAVPASPMQVVERAGARVILLHPGLYEVAVPAGQAPDLWDRLAQRARPAGSRGWDWHRIHACLPSITAATQDRFTPQMADQERLGAVSFGKGCYPGQEIVARSQYLGQVKRRLFRVHTEAGAMTAGQDILAEGSAVGTILNAEPAPGGGSDGLAVLQAEAAARALVLSETLAPLTVAAACHAT
jgi:folate-binding protein YgfZ